MKKLNILHHGPFPDELDGGASVNYWLWNMAYKLMPRYQHFAIPKNPEELNPKELPFMNFLQIKSLDEIPSIMYSLNIPIIETFHVPDQTDKYVSAVHDVGGKVLLHQTVHWADDQCFKMRNLTDMDFVVAPTLWAKEQLIINGKLDAKRVLYLPHGVDCEKFYPRKTTTLRKNLGLENKKVILFNGRYSTWKGLHSLIPLIRPLTEQYNCALIIRACAFGDANSPQVRMHELFSRLASQNKNLILLDKWLPYDTMPEVAASCDIACNPSGHEGFNVPNIEGMASGKPVITSLIPNHEEIVGEKAGLFAKCEEVVGIVNDDKSTGYKGTEVKVPSSEGLFGCIKFLLENPEECEIMGQAGRQRVEQMYNLAYIADAWLKTFEQIASKHDMSKASTERLLKL